MFHSFIASSFSSSC